MELQIHPLGPGQTEEFIQVLNIFREVFENEDPLPEPGYLQSLLARPDFKVVAAFKNGAVVGGLTMYLFPQYYKPKPIAYYYDLGVAPAYQRQGIGKALVEEACRYCQRNGIEEAYVEAEADDAEAISFYRSTSCRTETLALHFNYLL